MEELNSTLILSKHKLWYLLQAFGPGTVIGVIDPTTDLAAEKFENLGAEIEKSLLIDGFLYESDDKTLKLNEKLARLLYACVHPKHVLAVKDFKTNKESFYYFLPGWQMKLMEQSDQYILTFFKDRVDMLSSIFSLDLLVQLPAISSTIITVSERDFETALYLFREGNVDKALSVIGQEKSKATLKNILRMCSLPDLYLDFNMIYHINNQKLLNNTQQQLIQSQGQLYWLTRYYHEDQQCWVLEIQSISSEKLKDRIFQMLPSSY